MKISEITYTTDKSNFLNYDKLSSKLELIDIIIRKIEDNIMMPTEGCMTNVNGGLDENSFDIDNKPILYDRAKEVMQVYKDLVDTYKQAKEKILSDGLKHRQEELEKYISSINERIDVVESNLSRVESDINQEMAMEEKNTSRINELYALKDKYQKELNGGWFSNGLYDDLSWSKRELE